MNRAIDLTNKHFGKWIVLRRATTHRSTSGTYWVCQCECGIVKEVTSNSLRRGKSTRCPTCAMRKLWGQRRKKSDLIGRCFGQWRVLSKSSEGQLTQWLCQCDCGEVRKFESSVLLSGRAIFCKKCGYESQNRHRKQFVVDGKLLGYEELSAELGITAATLKFRLATMPKTKALTKTLSKTLTFDGMTLTIVEWSKRLGVRPALIYDRLRKSKDTRQVLLALTSDFTRENLLRLMAAKGLSGGQVARRTHLSEQTVHGILYGGNKPHARTLHRLADGLGVKVDEFFVDPRSVAPPSSPKSKEK